MKVKSAIYRGRIRGIEDAAEFWKPDHENAMCARDVEDMVHECLGIVDFLREWQQSTLKSAFFQASSLKLSFSLSSSLAFSTLPLLPPPRVGNCESQLGHNSRKFSA